MVGESEPRRTGSTGVIDDGYNVQKEGRRKDSRLFIADEYIFFLYIFSGVPHSVLHRFLC